jgi:hypothetical protein
MQNEGLLHLGSWLGRHQAFHLLANRCSAADAECLRAIRTSGEYKKLGLNWEKFCKQYAGVSRVYADRLIGYLDEFGASYFRLAELMQISAETYRLIAGSVSEEGLEHSGERIPIAPENRSRLTAAVQQLRVAGSTKVPTAASLGKRLDSFLEEAQAAAAIEALRPDVAALLDRSLGEIARLAEGLRTVP